MLLNMLILWLTWTPNRFSNREAQKKTGGENDVYRKESKTVADVNKVAHTQELGIESLCIG